MKKKTGEHFRVAACRFVQVLSIFPLGIALAAPEAFSAEVPSEALADLTLEQLSNIDVTSVSKKSEPLSGAAASIFVITGEDIRRAGATTIPEALRLAPNLQVAQVDSARYAISSRGFNNSNALSNKLLVLIDGRTVYNPLFSGVFWEQQDVLLEDVERIEVISGPGGTLWGSNAVNGVINVITRPASDTQGGFIDIGGGKQQDNGALRYGAKIGPDSYLRVYGKFTDHENTEHADGSVVLDAWSRQQAGFRADWGGRGDTFTLQGDTYTGQGESRPLGGPVKVSGANLLARWNRQFESGSDISLQTYYDRSDLEDQIGFQGDVDTFDVAFQNGVPLGAHKALWGAGYRTAHDNVPSTTSAFPLLIEFRPQSSTSTWENVFVQDEVGLGDTVRLTAGIKLEKNDYTGWEKLPSVRLAWQPADKQLIWGAVSRAVRAPARLDRDFFFTLVLPPPIGKIPLIVGGPDFVSEVANVIELGYRTQLGGNFSWSVTAFRHYFDRLRSGQPPPAVVQNMIKGTVDGVETWATCQATRAWRLSAGVVVQNTRLHVEPGSLDPTGPSALGNDPNFYANLRSMLDLTERLRFDVMVRRVGELPDPAVPAYTAVDARLAWQAQSNLELSLLLNNIFDPEHPEFGDPNTRSELDRTFYAQARWFF
jgi:iron complex outermembrane receptor protein